MQLRALTLVVLAAGSLTSCTGTGDTSTPGGPSSTTPSSSNTTPSAPAPGVNRPPGAVSVDFQPKTPILAGATAVSLAATVTDPDGDALSFSWDMPDGELKSQGGGISYTFERGGNYRIKVVVTDGKGGTSTGETTLTVRTLEGTWALVSPVGQNMTTNIRHNGRSFSGQFSDGKHSFTGNVNDGGRVFMRLEDGGEFYCLTGGNYNGTINDSLDFMEFSRGPSCYTFGLRRL
jgi:PKD repeat protein